jgi:nitroimidazol reductase NimA-like FMN-containing flavoprotein (pyridoxamine 5'-phosphate oxidase superfamily)
MMGVLDEQKINNVLSSQVVGRLACTDGNIPYIVPVTYFFNGEYIYGQTQEGKKLEILRKNKKICFEVDLMMDMRNWQSVIVFGDFEELSEAEAKIAKELFFNHFYNMQTSSTVHGFQHQLDDKTKKSNDNFRHIMYRIRPIKVTGRFEKG